ncbi:MAG: hypothetical protein LBU56_03525 [Rickettsiales bacterium]|jgi:hypothetical protein|nr:hypothetical protein [Rickettsiales bacterium]
MRDDFDKLRVFMGEQEKIAVATLDKMGEKAQENFIKEFTQISFSFWKEVELLFLAMKKPKILTAADLNLAVMNQDQYVKISYQPVRGDSGHAVLIKKNSDNSFTFYDPNYGAVFDLTEEQLCEVVTQSFYDYVRISKLGIATLFILLTSVVIGIVAAVYGYTITATVSLIVCLVGLSISCCLREKVIPQEYNTIVLADSVAALRKSLEIEFKNLIDKYCGDNGRSEDVVAISDAQVENATKNLAPGGFLPHIV